MGNKTFSDEELYHALGIQRPWWQRILFKEQKPRVEDRLLPILLEELKNFYKDQGFWEVAVDIRMEKDTALFLIREGRPIIVADIFVDSDFPIRHLIRLRPGERFVASRFVSTKEAIKKALLEEGYCSYDFDPKAFVYKKRYQAYLRFRLKKGEICRIKRVEVHGLETIDPEVVLSHIYLRPGADFSLEKVTESYRRLYSLEFFRFITIDYSKKIDNQILLDISLKERDRRNVYKAGLGFDTQNGFHVSFFYKHLNFHQSQPSIQLFYSAIKQEAAFNLFYPSVELFGSYFDTVASISYAYNLFEGFSQKSTKTGLKLLKDYFNLHGSLKLNMERTRIFDSTACIPQKSYLLLYPELFLLFDQRDSKIHPTKGYFLKESLAASLSAYTFAKNRVEAGLYLPFERVTLFVRSTLGTIFASDLPPDKLFYAGGAKSNRAYTYRQLTALDSDCPIGGKTLLEFTLEPRYHYDDRMQLALFWDRTYLSSHEFRIDGYKDGVGVGVVYQTPMGELKAYFGVDPKDPNQNALNIYLGAAF